MKRHAENLATKAVAAGIKEPLDLINLALDQSVLVKMKGDRELTGTLHAYDQHMNLVLGAVTERRTAVTRNAHEDDAPTLERHLEMLYVRGDSIILVAPSFG